VKSPVLRWLGLVGIGRGLEAVGAVRGDAERIAAGEREVVRQTGTSALRRQRLAQPEVVAARVSDGGIANAVRLIDGLLEDLRPGGAQ
jgi:hypothetical protein